MSELIEFFGGSRFMMRGHCGDWDPTFEALYIAGHLGITLAYLSLPAMMLALRWEWNKVAYVPAVRRWFVAFIVCCGIGHLEGFISFFFPAYHLFACWHLLTAYVSWHTVYILSRERIW